FITTWEDLTTRFLAQFFPPGRTAKPRNDILMFQQHHEESLSEAWTCFPHHGIDRWLQIQIFYNHVSFHLKCEIDRASAGKLHDRFLGIIENLALYDHEGWNDTKEFVKPIKAISTPSSTSKTPDRRLFKLEDHINFLLKGSRPTPRSSSTHISQAYAEAVYSNPQLMTSRAPEKVLIREEAKFPITKNVNSISLTRGEEERSEKTDVTTGDDFEKSTTTETEMPVKEAKKEEEVENEPNRKAKKEETTKAPLNIT
nr:hypothetical protein [Tanacetum cinerariifolium]